MSGLRERIAAARTALGMSQQDLAAASGASQQTISEIESGDVTSPRKWREIADVLDIPHDEMRQLMIDASHAAGKQRISREAKRGNIPQSARDAVRANGRIIGRAPAMGARRVPVLGMAVGGAQGEYVFNGQAVDYVVCPPGLENVHDAYAVFVDGDSMAPRFKAGETVWVHPSRPPRKGDDVVVQIAASDGEPPHGYIKELVGWAGNILKLRQHNPAADVSFDRAAVVSVHTIVFSQKA